MESSLQELSVLFEKWRSIPFNPNNSQDLIGSSPNKPQYNSLQTSEEILVHYQDNLL